MNAIDIIKKDHRTVEDLFAQYKDAKDPEGKHRIAEQITVALENHAEMEETILYPKLREALGESDEELLDEAYEEHAEAKRLLEEIKTMEGADADLDDEITELEAAVQHHVEEEEAELLPITEKALSPEELEELANGLRDFKDQEE